MTRACSPAAPNGTATLIAAPAAQAAVPSFATLPPPSSTPALPEAGAPGRPSGPTLSSPARPVQAARRRAPGRSGGAAEAPAQPRPARRFGGLQLAIIHHDRGAFRPQLLDLLRHPSTPGQLARGRPRQPRPAAAAPRHGGLSPRAWGKQRRRCGEPLLLAPLERCA